MLRSACPAEVELYNLPVTEHKPGPIISCKLRSMEGLGEGAEGEQKARQVDTHKVL